MHRSYILFLALLAAAAGCGGTVETSSGGGAGSAGSGGSTAGTGGATGGSGGSETGGAGGSGGTGGVDRRACTSTQQCVLMAQSCCGYCSEQPISEFVAMNAQYAQDFYDELCGGGPIACPGCVTLSHPNYVARCIEGQCVERDVREETVSLCSTDDDCVLRWRGECCEACASTGWPEGGDLVAVNVDADFADVGCDAPIACDPCAPPEVPPEYYPYCHPDGHCRVVTLQD